MSQQYARTPWATSLYMYYSLCGHCTSVQNRYDFRRLSGVLPKYLANSVTLNRVMLGGYMIQREERAARGSTSPRCSSSSWHRASTPTPATRGRMISSRLNPAHSCDGKFINGLCR